MVFTAAISETLLVITPETGEPLGISRETLKECPGPEGFKAAEQTSFVFALGLFEVNSITYLALATAVETHCEFWNIQIVTGVKILQISLGKPDSAVESLLYQGLNLAPMFFSTTNDISNTAVGQAEHVSPRNKFVWNAVPLEKLLSVTKRAEEFTQRVIVGFVGQFQTENCVFCLISRRSSVRAGSRFWVRGADDNGNVANFVETEQVLVHGDVIYSFVQIRGSVPVLWTQFPCLGQLPPIILGSVDDCVRVLNAHFRTLCDSYGDVVAVSLIDNKGREKGLSERYNELGSRMERVTFEYFDFHKECAKMHWENIDKLIEKINDKLVYSKIVGGNVVQKQTGAVRTNCLDCLDRTNVVQSSIAKVILKKQLEEIGSGSDCDQQFRNTWTDNADAISCQYAGTPALKTDFTRTGKRSMWGVLGDVRNSITRFYINTCQDGTRQDAYDAVTQRVKCTGYGNGNGLLRILVLGLWACIVYILLIVIRGKEVAKRRFIRMRSEYVNRPHFLTQATVADS